MSLMATWATAIKIKVAAVSLVCSQKPVDTLGVTGSSLEPQNPLWFTQVHKGLGSWKYLSFQFNGEKNTYTEKASVQKNGAFNMGNFTHYVTRHFLFLFSAEGGWKKIVTLRHLQLPKVKSEKNSSALSKRGEYSRRKSATQCLEFSGGAKLDLCSDASLTTTDTSFYSGISQGFKASGDWGIGWI